MTSLSFHLLIFFFNDTATTEIYTLSLHDALPIYVADHLAAAALVEVDVEVRHRDPVGVQKALEDQSVLERVEDRKSTRLNSSHANISYAVFCLKKKQQLSRP